MTAPTPLVPARMPTPPPPTPEPFDIRGPLPTGTTLLEASAGTGKTWTIGALVARFVAEGVCPLDKMLVVTFGRAASRELRERVRAQLVDAERALDPDPSLGLREDSELTSLLLECDAEERARRRRNLTQALAAFDAATIATTHQFCALVLSSLGVAGDSDARATLVEDLDDLLREVVDDLYLRAYAYDDQTPAFGHDEAMRIARKIVEDPQAQIEPHDAPRDTPAGRRVAFAQAVRGELDRRKRRLGILSYDDLLSQVADALEADDADARARLRQRWSLVLVDEFQDTDPVQWRVLDRAFTAHATMVLIGDPKQAIYAFRGGDVTTYLEAAETATRHQTLPVSWRSDAPLLEALEALLGGAALGDERIVVHPVRAHHPAGRLEGAPVASPLRVRVVRRSDLGVDSGALTVAQARPHIARDLAADVRRLLAARPSFAGEPLKPHQVAVIASKHDRLAEAQRALHAAGIPAVVAGAGSVFATPAAREWLQLLEALEQPHRTARVHAAALTSFVGSTAAELDAGGERLTDDLADRFREWAEAFVRRGVAAVLEAATAGGLPARVLCRVGGERLLTDLRHVGEVLHEAALQERLGVTALLAWLRRQVREAGGGRGTERTRRLDSDALAVQLVTVHASKGMEYAVVYLPDLADRWVGDPTVPLFHDDAGRRCLDVGAGDGPHWRDHVGRHRAEDAGESLRLLYVAMTRAKSQVVCWWAPTTRNTECSPLHRMLARSPGAPLVPERHHVWEDAKAVEVFTAWRERGALLPEVSWPAETPEEPPRPMPAALAVREFTRSVDVAWRRTSYSSLVSVEIAPRVGSEPEVTARTDEAVGTRAGAAGGGVVVPAEAGGTPPMPSPMAALPVGARFGSLVHAVLEHADPGAPDWRAELLAAIDEQRVRWPVDLDREQLAEALVRVCDSPLGPLAGDLTLRQVPLSDRLREMDFELPLCGGDLARGGATRVRLGDLAPLLRRRLPADDPMRRYADALDQPALGGQELRGYLTGSLDAVLRLAGPTGPRYLVVDYKTNWLGPADEPLLAASYRPEALAAAMAHSDYPLQALLYAAVLHRFLRWRQPGYDPERHLGGVLYLYVRGMCGPGTPVVDGEPCGVFSWRPPVALVEDLSDLLDGAEP